MGCYHSPDQPIGLPLADDVIGVWCIDFCLEPRSVAVNENQSQSTATLQRLGRSEDSDRISII